MTLHLWPRRLATRTAVVVLVGLALVQIAGLTIHALDRIDIQRLSQARNIAVRVVGLYRLVATTTPAGRDAVLVDMRRGPILDAEMSQTPPTVDMPEMPPPEQRLYRVNLSLVPMGAPQNRWKELVILGGPDWHRIVFGMKLPEGDWLNVTIAAEPARPWHSPTFLAAFGLMTLAAALLTVWAVRRLITPVQTLGAARQHPAAARDRSAGNRHGRSRLQHDGRPHPPLRGGPDRTADRDRTRPPDPDHPTQAPLRVRRGRGAAD